MWLMPHRPLQGRHWQQALPALCAIGTWSNATGATSEAACMPCAPGSTTETVGSGEEDLCIRPHSDQPARCVSGQGCSIHLTGFHLRDGHRAALSLSEDCGDSKLPVGNVGDGGMSQPATPESIYTWSDKGFLPEGGRYRLCWCANMAGLACAGLESFPLPAGHLQVDGPYADHLFNCVRGKDCNGLQPFRGAGLTPLDRVTVRNGGCGGAVQAVSVSNPNGLAALEPTVASFSLHFGTSDVQLGLDHTVLLDASETGYELCWCGGPEPCSLESFLVSAGKLRIEGPYVNQEISCSIGQPCTMPNIRSMNATPGDRVMVLSACGAGAAVQGIPGGGVAQYVEAGLLLCRRFAVFYFSAAAAAAAAVCSLPLAS